MSAKLNFKVWLQKEEINARKSRAMKQAARVKVKPTPTQSTTLS